MTKDPNAPELPPKELFEIVGVVRDAKYMTVREDPRPTVFAAGRRPINGSYAVRTAVEPMTLVSAIRTAAKDIHPDLRLSEFRTQDAQAALTFAKERHFAILSSVIGALALGLTAIGLYGLLSFRVARRKQEIGIHMALGAERRHVVRSVASETLALVMTGVAAGLGAAIAASRLIRGMLYGIDAHDPAALAAAVALMLIVAALSAALPAWRATRVDPLTALRCE